MPVLIVSRGPVVQSCWDYSAPLCMCAPTLVEQGVFCINRPTYSLSIMVIYSLFWVWLLFSNHEFYLFVQVIISSLGFVIFVKASLFSEGRCLVTNLSCMQGGDGTIATRCRPRVSKCGT